MRLVVCQHPDISIVGGERSLRVGAGGVVDLDDVIGVTPAVRDAAGAIIAPETLLTVEDALGSELLKGFTPVVDASPNAAASADAPKSTRGRAAPRGAATQE